MVRRSNDSSRPVPEAPSFRLEAKARRGGARFVAGVDEAGRGPLAGPVAVAAVVFEGPPPEGLNDSKKLTKHQRAALFDLVMLTAHVSVVIASRARIDRMNILQASLWGMCRAVSGLPVTADHALIDGNIVPPKLACRGEAIVGGDSVSVSIAAASIVAKVTRDRLMEAVDRSFPDYGFGSHKGYSTRAHFDALDRHGPCEHHRISFAPVRELQRELPF